MRAKANQYFLRGFNLDHGTDIAITVDGMPVNMRTHAHGQGYADLNFLIPELVGAVEFHKGPYFRARRRLRSAGSVRIDYLDKLNRNIALTTLELSVSSEPSRPPRHRSARATCSWRARRRPMTARGWCPIPSASSTAWRYSQGTPLDGFAVTGMPTGPSG